MLHGHMAELGLAVGLLLGLFVALELGYRLGRRHFTADKPPAAGHVGAVQAAMLGLLGLLLGFSFAGAQSRFVDRQDLVVQEANAIGTAYLRADLLPEAYAVQMRHALRDYIAHRLEAAKHIGAGTQPQSESEAAVFHARMWEAAKDGTLNRPEVTKSVLDPVNAVIDLHATRLAAGRRHLPVVVLALLIACSLLSMSVIGYGSGVNTGTRWPWLNGSLAILIAAALWTTIDLDHPRAGLIHLSDHALQSLHLQLSEPAGQR